MQLKVGVRFVNRTPVLRGHFDFSGRGIRLFSLYGQLFKIEDHFLILVGHR
jgi:hypothetical protein